MRMSRRAAVFSQLQRGIVYDSFNRADGDIGTADSGQVWFGDTSPLYWSIVSNKAKRTKLTPALFASAALTLPQSIGDYTVEADITMNATVSGDYAGLFGRGHPDCAYSVAVSIYNTGMALIAIGSGRTSSSTLATYSYSWTPGERHKIRLVLSGTNAYVYLDETQIMTSAISAWSGGSFLDVGMIARFTTSAPKATFDNFKVY